MTASGSLLNNRPPNNQPQDDTKYDYHHIQYSPISVDQWNNAPVQQSDYSNYWATPQSFQPQTFASNTQKESKWNDIGWNWAFWVNFLITLALFAYLSYRAYDSSSKASLLEITEINTNQILSALGISVGIAIGLNILHLVYAIFLPVVYVELGLIIDLVLSIAAAVFLGFVYKLWLFLIFPGVMIFFALCWYCIRRQYIKISAAILKTSIKIVLKYPGTIAMLLVQGVISFLVTLLFSYIVYLVVSTNFSPYILIYFAFSYLWITLAFGYVTYMTIAGLAASWYFLNDTEFFPKHPLGSSFKRAITSSFGSASEAAFILAVIQVLRMLCEMDVNGGNNVAAIVICILRCIALCVLGCLERIFGILNRYALIYCATFGIPYREGCRRILESFFTKFIDVLLSSCVISDVTSFNGLVFTAIGCLIGYGVGYIGKNVTMAIWTCIFSGMFTLCLIVILLQPMIVTADTLLVCFSENPEKLNTTAAELAEELRRVYGEQLEKKVQRSHPE